MNMLKDFENEFLAGASLPGTSTLGSDSSYKLNLSTRTRSTKLGQIEISSSAMPLHGQIYMFKRVGKKSKMRCSSCNNNPRLFKAESDFYICGICRVEYVCFDDEPFRITLNFQRNTPSDKWFRVRTFAPSINGNNGEWTNSDDLDNMLQAAAELERQMARPGHRVEEVNRRNANARVNNRPNQGVPHQPRVVPTNFHVSTRDLNHRGYFFENQYYSHPIYPIIPPGVYQDFEVFGCGWCKAGEKPRANQYVEAGWHTYEIPEHWTITGRKTRQEFVLPLQVIKSIDSKLRLSQITESNLNSATNLIVRTIINLPLHITTDIKAYLHQLVLFNFNNHQRLSYGILEIQTENPYAVLAEYENDAMDTVDFHEPRRIYAVPCNENFFYKVDPTIVIEGDTMVELEGTPHRREVIDTNRHGHPEDQVPHWYRTMMFSLEGENKFVQYDNSTHNTNKALKRLIAEEDHHVVRNSCEKYFANIFGNTALARSLPHAQDIINCVNPPMPDQLEAAIVATIHDDKYLMAIDKASNDLCNFLEDRFNRTWIDFALESGLIAGDWLYNTMYLKYMEYVEPIYSRWENANIPHVKKALRQGYVHMRGQFDTDDLMVTRLKANLKNELAKFRKAPRITVGYDAGCMYANELPDFIKACMVKKLYRYVNNHHFHVFLFAKPKMDEIQNVFNDIAKGLSSDTTYICIYSDDSVWARGGPDGFSVNVDISACDKSIRSLGFMLSGFSLANFDVERAIGLIEQCKKPITLTSRDGQKTMKISREEDGKKVPIEGSGTTLTTINNFFAMLANALVYIHAGDYSILGIKIAGIATGLNLEVSDDFSDCPEKLQFLKYSPCLTVDGSYILVRNLGCMLRGLGKVDGDLSALQLGCTNDQFRIMPWAQRCDLFCSSVVNGFVHEPNHIIMASLRSRFASPSKKEESLSHIITASNSHVTVLDESLAKRYDLSVDDLHQLSSEIASIVVGRVVVSDVLSKIYKTDYCL
jgi:hypothetical protein